MGYELEQERCSGGERAWIANSGDAGAAAWLIRYARAFNLLDVAPLARGLSPTVTYESQSVFDTLSGPENLVTYWKNKFSNIRESEYRIAAELATLPGGKPCVAMYQAASAIDANWLDSPLGAMTIQTDADGCAESFLMITCVPAPSSARGSGILPGLAEPPELQPRRSIPRLSAFDEIELYVFYLDGRTSLDQAMKASVEQARRALPGIVVVELTYEDSDAQPDCAKLHLFHFNGFPGVGAMYAGRPIYRHQGLIRGADLVTAVRASVNQAV